MKFQIKHEIKGRMRLHIFQKKQMSCEQADILLYYLENIEGVESAKVYERTADAVVRYAADKDGFVRQNIIKEVQKFVYDKVEVPDGLIENSGRELNREFQEKLIGQITAHYARKFLLPAPFRAVYTGIKSLGYIWKGLQTLAQRKLEVPVLDATAIGVSILRGNYDTASSVMFLLGIGELLEDWTHKKSVGDLARIMSLNVEKVWLKTEDGEVLVPYSQIKQGDSIVVHMGNVIPFDGTVLAGEAMVNQASLTGESMPVSGKYMEAVAEADTIVFDKTGTLTKAEPTVAEVVPFGGNDADEMLRMAACMEEHFPHSMAKAVVDAAAEKNLEHEEVHSEVEYIVAHGISSMIDGQKVVIGSHHFVFEDEKCTVDPEKMGTFNSLE